ncbi:uncharacterized protein LOC123309289 [Coccinella septempunctata]|uniref:uncharacterized protein LOC123309289 n=1 Tax=Coccinella septempunctata TaxID=41139 RepID=UPI001D07992B|nr:uncharacterized protein LOC123309289 [Coccinella septempunctata]
MVSFKIVSIFLIYIFADTVICGRLSFRTGISENENNPYVHNIKARSAFVKPLKHVIGHIADHLGIHSRHPGCDDRHFHHHHGFSLGHRDNTHPGYNFPVFHDSNVYHGPPPFQDENRHDFHPHGPVRDPQFNPNFPVNNNNDFHGFHKDRPDKEHEIPVEKDERPSTDVDKKFGTKKPAAYPSKNEGDTSKNDEDYPVSDFEKNDKKNGKNPFVNEGGSVDLESDFSGENNGKKEANDSRDWVVEPEDEVKNAGSGEIPSTSQIDIRFRKD